MVHSQKMKFVGKVVSHPMLDGILPYVRKPTLNEKLSEMDFMHAKW